MHSTTSASKNNCTRVISRCKGKISSAHTFIVIRVVQCFCCDTNIDKWKQSCIERLKLSIVPMRISRYDWWLATKWPIGICTKYCNRLLHQQLHCVDSDYTYMLRNRVKINHVALKQRLCYIFAFILYLLIINFFY